MSPAIRASLIAGGMNARARVGIYAAAAQTAAYETLEKQHEAERAATAACQANSAAKAAAEARIAASSARAAVVASGIVTEQLNYAREDAEANDPVSCAFVEAIAALEVAAKGAAKEAAEESEQAQAAAHQLAKRALEAFPS